MRRTPSASHCVKKLSPETYRPESSVLSFGALAEFAKIQEQRIVSNFALVRYDPLRDVNLAYSVLGVREVHHLEGGKETVSKIVAHYNVRLAPAMRTEFDSSGLRVADFWEEQVLGEQDNRLNQPDDLTHSAARQVAAEVETQ
jgi:hypothetical protein